MSMLLGAGDPPALSEEERLLFLEQEARREQGRVKHAVRERVAVELPLILSAHGLDRATENCLEAVMDLQIRIEWALIDRQLRIEKLPQQRMEQGFRTEDMIAIENHAGRLIGYANKLPRNPGTVGLTRQKIVKLVDRLPRVVRLASVGLPQISAIIERIGNGMETVSDLDALRRAVKGYRIGGGKLRGRSESDYRPIMHAALNVWLAHGEPVQWQGKMSLLTQILELGGYLKAPSVSAKYRGDGVRRSKWKAVVRDQFAQVAAAHLVWEKAQIAVVQNP